MLTRTHFLERFTKNLAIQPSLRAYSETRDEMVALCKSLIDPSHIELGLLDQFIVLVDFMEASKEAFHQQSAIDSIKLELAQPIHPEEPHPEKQKALQFLIDSEDQNLKARQYKNRAYNNMRYLDSVFALDSAMEHATMDDGTQSNTTLTKLLIMAPAHIQQKYMNLIFDLK